MDLIVDNVTSLLSSFQGQSLALSFYRGRSLVGRLTYDELREQVFNLSYHLTQELGVKKGDRILILSLNCLEIPVILLALFHIGAIAVPLNPYAQAEDWEYIARHSGARGIFVAPNLQIKGYAFDFILITDEVLKIKNAPPDAFKKVSEAFPQELAIVLYTSGTTGNPKGVGLSQQNLFSNAKSMTQHFELSRTTQFSVLPLYHAHALGFGLMTALTTSGHLIFTDKFDPFAWTEIIQKEEVIYTSVIPNLIPMLLAARVHKEKVPTLKAILVSSAPLTTDLAREFETKTQIPLIQGWGLSEYTNFACCLSLHETMQDHQALLFEQDFPSIGSPLYGTEVKIIDSNGNALGEMQQGELCVRGPSLMIGYYREPETTQNTLLEDGWLRTGDQGRYQMHKGKAVFFITGRIKEIIIRDGEKYNPLAIEKKISNALPELMGKMIILGFEHHLHGEEIGAYLEIDSLSDMLRAKLLATVESLPIETRPKVVLYSQNPIPRTHTGKIQRRKLKPLFAKHLEFKGPIQIIPAHDH